MKASGHNPPFFLLVSQLVTCPFSKEDFWSQSQPLVDNIVCAHTGRCYQTLCGVQVFVHMPTKDVQVLPGRELSAGNSGVSILIPVLTEVIPWQQETSHTGCSGPNPPIYQLSLKFPDLLCTET